MTAQVFLGGACGPTTWRRDIAIPALQAAGVSYYDPQLGIGEWNESREAEEMAAKDTAHVLMFVISRETRGVATVGEAAYYLAAGRLLALVVQDIPSDAAFPDAERDDLNRGRIFVRTMARQQGVAIFDDVPSAVQHAIALVKGRRPSLTRGSLQEILNDIEFQQSRFLIHERPDGFFVQLAKEEDDVETGQRELYYGRKWFVERTATRSEVVRTAFKAVVTWQEHEARDHFTYRGQRIFGPHVEVDDLLNFKLHDAVSETVKGS